MAVTFVSASTIVANNTTTTLAMTMPTVQDNDIAIGFIYADSDQVHTFPANWTKFVEQAGTTSRDTVAWKRVAASESGGTVNVTKPTDDNVLFCGVIYIFRGCITSSSPIDASTSQANNTAATTIAYPTLDPTQATHVVFLGSHQNLTTWNAVPGTNPTPTLRDDQETATGADASLVCCSGDGDGAATGTRTQTQNGTSVSAISIASVFALIAASGATTLTPSAVTAAWAANTPTVVKGGVLKTPSPVVATFVTPTPAVIKGGVLKTPSPVIGSFAVNTPSMLLGGVTKTPSPVIATYGIPAPTVTNDSGDVLTPTPVVATWVTQTPNVARGGIVLTPTAAAALFGVPVVTLLKGGIFVIPSSVQAVFIVPAPTVTGGEQQQQDLALYFRYK